MLLQSDFIDLETPTGVMRTYVHKPTRPGKYPAILFYSEIFQQTGPIERAAKIIASHGYTVLVPEVFHELNPIGTILEYVWSMCGISLDYVWNMFGMLLE